MNSSLLYTLAMIYLPGIGSVNANRILKAVESPKLIWEMSYRELNEVFKNRKELISQILNGTTLELAQKEIFYAQNNGIQILTKDHSNYPQKLKECVDSPPVLFQKGNHDFNQKLHIAIVGTRKMTHYGKNFIDKLLSELAQFSFVIVSGLAYGCDIEAHKKSNELQIPNIAVLAHGLNKISPKAHISEAQKIINNGCLLTEYSTFHQAEPINFVLRNRIIAGLCDGIIVVESDKKGGALTTANFANNYNREVFALPGRVEDKYSLGCNHLIQSNQAMMVRNAQDLLNYFDLKTTPKPKQKQLFIELEPEEELIYSYLVSNGKQQIDQLANGLGIPTFRLHSILLTLELKGVLKPTPGKFYELA